jgi:hypothetical protein
MMAEGVKNSVLIARRVLENFGAKTASVGSYFAEGVYLVDINSCLSIGLRYVLLTSVMSALADVSQSWSGLFFESTSLKALGMRIHLGHNGNTCPLPGAFHKDFVVMATTGIHHVDVQFCGCYSEIGASHPCLQLLRAELLPSSVDRPTGAFTFDVLNSFHLLTLQGMTSAYDYCISISRKTDNLGLLHSQKVSISGMNLVAYTDNDVSTTTTIFYMPCEFGDI